MRETLVNADVKTKLSWPPVVQNELAPVGVTVWVKRDTEKKQNKQTEPPHFSVFHTLPSRGDEQLF